MSTYAILDRDGNIVNTIVADQAFIDSQGFAQFLIIDQWLDGSKGPIDTTRRWDEKSAQFVDSQTARAKQSREQADRPSETDRLASALADKVSAVKSAVAVPDVALVTK